MSEKTIEERRLDARLKIAVVDLVDEENNLYEVFVPGAVREVTRVTADSEEEAVAKVRSLLLAKAEHFSQKKQPTGVAEPDLQVDNGTTGHQGENLEEIE